MFGVIDLPNQIYTCYVNLSTSLLYAVHSAYHWLKGMKKREWGSVEGGTPDDGWWFSCLCDHPFSHAFDTVYDDIFISY